MAENPGRKYGPWALITGASEGTGAAFARRLADQGIHCILIARRDGPLQALAGDIRAKGVECITASVDLSADDAATQVIAAAGDRDIGLFIANAGADTNGSLFLESDIAGWDRLVTMNVLTTMRLAHHFGQAMVPRGRGGILLVGSGACYGGLGGIAVYTGVKAFLLCFSEGLWAELRHRGIDTLYLVLGRTDTPAHRKLLESKGAAIPDDMAMPDDVAGVGLARLPHGPVHNWGQPDAVAGYAPNAPDERRARILAIERMMTAYQGDKDDKGDEP